MTKLYCRLCGACGRPLFLEAETAICPYCFTSSIPKLRSAVLEDLYCAFFYGALGIDASYSSSTRVAVLEDLYCDYWLMPFSWQWHPTALVPGSNEFPIV